MLSLLCVHGWEKPKDLFVTSEDVQKRKDQVSLL